VDALSTKVANLYALLWSGNYTLSSSNSLTITGVSSSNMANPVIMIKAYLPGSNSAYSPSAGTGTDYVIYIPIKLHEQSNVNSSGYSYYYSSITYGSSYMALQYKQQTNSLILTTTGSTIYITEVAALFIG
jgi:hypothetical protein